VGSVTNPLSLVVLLFDFPPTIKDYAHCIGRTHRPGQRSGRVVAFIPEMRFWIARELVSLLTHCGQPVPRQLEDLVHDDITFIEDCRAAMLRMRDGQSPCPEAGSDLGDFDTDRGVWRLPPALPSYRRKLLHWLADEIGLPHVSAGEEVGTRRLHVALDRDDLPDKFFLEGEDVVVSEEYRHRFREFRERGVPSRTLPEGELCGKVVDPRVHRRTRTVRLRFHGHDRDDEVNVPVDLVTPCGSGNM